MSRSASRTRPPAPAEDSSRPGSFNWRELALRQQLLIFLVLSFVVLSVIWSLDRARWIPGMRPLVPVGLMGLTVGYLFSRIRWPGVVLHPLALTIGFVVVLWQASLIVPGAGLGRWIRAIAEIKVWAYAIANGETSGGMVTFAAVLLTLSWLLGYFSAWLVLRGHRAWWAIVPAGILLSVNLGYFHPPLYLHLVPYVLSSLLLVAYLNLCRRQQRWRAKDAAYSKLAGLSFAGYTLWFISLAALIAWNLPQPRIGVFTTGEAPASSAWERVQDNFGRVFASIQGKEPIYSVSAGSSYMTSSKPSYVVPSNQDVRLGGSFELGGQIIFIAESGQPRYWRIRNYDIYTTQGWFTSDARSDVSLAAGSAIPSGEKDGLLLRSSIQTTIKMQVYSRTFLSAGEPLSVNLSSVAEVRDPPSGIAQSFVDTVLLRTPKWLLRPHQSYTITSSISIAGPKDLISAGTDYPFTIGKRYLQIPAQLPPRIASLARNVVRGVANPYDKAMAIQDYLQKEMKYNTSITAPPQGQDGIDHFLFTSREGYCNYFASAMTVMLRSVGVPARLVVGYLPGEPDSGKGTYTIRERQYHAWVDVYFPSYGWVEFDPTPSGQQVAGASAADEEISDFIPPEELQTTDGGASAGIFSRGVYWKAPLLLAALLFAMGPTFVLVRWRRRQSFLKGLSYAGRLYADLCWLSSLSGLRPRPHATPSEYAVVLCSALPSQSEAIGEIVQAYNLSLFAPPTMAADARRNERLARTWRHLRRRLWTHFIVTKLRLVLSQVRLRQK